MFKHYLSTALRHFARHKTTTAINILCLWFGLIAFAIAYGLEAYTRHMDAHHEKAKRTYFITQDSRFLGGSANSGPAPYAGFAIAPRLKADYPDLEHVARVTLGHEIAIATESTKQFAGIAYADPSILDILDFDFVSGNRRTALQTPNSVIVSKDFATRIFGDKNPIGQALVLNNSAVVHITGVIKPSRSPSLLTPDSLQGSPVQFSLITSMDTRQALVAAGKIDDAGPRGEYFQFQVFTYVLFRENGDLTPEKLRSELASFSDRHVPPEVGRAVLGLRPVTGMGAALFNFNLQAHRTGISQSAVLMTIGALILLIACLNYANLASAQVSTQLKELALLRTVGASRRQIIAQIVIEALLAVFAAAALAAASLPGAVASLRVSLGLDYGPVLMQSMEFWLWWSVAIFGAAILASLYPSLIATRIRPAQSLHSGHVPQSRRRTMRIIVSAQCTIASLLLILASIVNAQSKAMSNANSKASGDPLIFIGNNLNAAGIDRTRLQTELRSQTSVTSVSAIDLAPGIGSGRSRIVMLGSEPSSRNWIVSAPQVDYDFFSTMGMSLLAGRDFDKNIASDLDSDQALGNVVIDTALAAQYGWNRPQDAIGKQIFVPSSGAKGAAGRPRTVVGVVGPQELYPYAIGMSAARFYTLNPARASTVLVRIPKDSVTTSTAAIDNVWNQLVPNIPLKRKFLDEQMKESNTILAAISTTENALAFLALFIATMGIVGIATHSINQRTIEIGIRKSLGASLTRVLTMLLKDFSKPILIGNLIAWPLAFVVGKGYLSIYAIQANVTPVPFVVSLLLALLTAWLAIGRQAWRAARLNPATVLRHE